MTPIPNLLRARRLSAVAGALLALNAQAGDAREEWRRDFDLTADGRVTIENVNGSVKITGWDKPGVQVSAVKVAANHQRLEAIKIEVEAEPDRLRIRTRYPERKSLWGSGGNSHEGRVDYTLFVPHGVTLDNCATVNGRLEIEAVHGDIEASTVNGALTAAGLVADAKLSSVNGTVRARVERLPARGRLDLNTVNGTVTIELPKTVDAEVEANTVNGSVSTDRQLTVKKNFPVGQELRGRLGAGGAKVRAGAVNGSVRITTAAAP